MTSHEFQLLMAQHENHSEALKEITTAVTAINGKVQKHEVDIQVAKRLGWISLSIWPMVVGIWKWFGKS